MRRVVVYAIACLVVTAGNAHAQMGMGSFKGYFTAHLGAIAGPDLTNERLAVGASVSVQEENGWGAELDLGHSWDAVAGRQILDVTTYTVNGSWVRPRGLIRPFGVAGGGVMQVSGCDAPCARAARTYDFGLTAGAGAFVVLHDMFGVRGDARYFFSSADHPDLRRPENFSFWRISIGATLMWAATP